MKLLLIAPLLFSSGTEQAQPNAYDVYDRLMEYSETTKSLDIQFTRRVHDRAGKVLNVARGRLYWEGHDLWSLRWDAVERNAPQPHTSSSASQDLHWIRHPSDSLSIDHDGSWCSISSETPGEESLSSELIRIGAGLATMDAFARYSMACEYSNGHVKVTLLPYGNPWSYGQYYLELDRQNLEPLSFEINGHGSSTVYTIESLRRDIVPQDRQELLYPCLWQFDRVHQSTLHTARPSPEPQEEAAGQQRNMAPAITYVLRLLIRGF